MTVPALLLCFMFAAGESRSEAEEMCGTYSLYVGLTSLDASLSGLDSIEETLGPPPPGGHSMAELAEAAQKLGFQTLGVKTTLENLAVRPGRFACIAHMKHGHFVLIGKSDESGVLVVDPPSVTTVLDNVWNAAWDGDCLLISAEPLLPEAEIETLAMQAADSQTTRRSMRKWMGVAIAASLMAMIAGVVIRKRRV